MILILLILHHKSSKYLRNRLNYHLISDNNSIGGMIRSIQKKMNLNGLKDF